MIYFAFRTIYLMIKVFKAMRGKQQSSGAIKDNKIIFEKNDEIKSITSVSKPRLICPELRNSSLIQKRS
jgi:hypothetical protein